MPRRTEPEVWRRLPQPFLAPEAAAAGLTSRALRGATNRGDLRCLAEGLYAVVPDWLEASEAQRHRATCRAALLATPGCAVGHVSAATVLGLPTPAGPLGPVRLVALDGQLRTGPRGGWRVVLHGSLEAGEWEVRDELVVTTPGRTVADCLRTMRLTDGLAVADQALRCELTTTGELVDMRRRMRRWPGVLKLRTAIGLVDHRRESWLESASVAAAHLRGLGRPLSQVWIHTLDGRLVGRVDFLWPALGVIGEADGLGKYRGDFDDAGGGPDAVARRVLAERDRERALEALGFGVARWGVADLRHGGLGLARSVDAAARRSRLGRIRCLWRQDLADPMREWPPPPSTPPT